MHRRRAGEWRGAQFDCAGGVWREHGFSGGDASGNTVYFPVNVKGGLLYLGDGHAAMGDGEAAGSAIEVPLKARGAGERDQGAHDRVAAV